MEEKEREIGEIIRNNLVWVEKRYEMDPMDCWINGYRTALHTVLREANRRHKEKKEVSE